MSRAIQSRVESAPQAEHYLLWDGREAPSKTGKQWRSVERLPSGFLQRVKAISKAIAETEPDIVHAHSSWAGVYARIVKRTVPIVYEPHCFKFDDPAQSPLLRFLYRLAEKMLIPRTAVFAVLSQHEEQLLKRMSDSARAVRIPNVPSLPSPEGESLPKVFVSVAMVGRICAQKDPEYFLKVANEVRAETDAMKFVWIGDGDPQSRSRLEAAGVKVTGWLDTAALREQLTDTLYFHSAAYEGFPLSVLDAASQKAPIVARKIPAFVGTPISSGSSPKEIAKMLIQMSTPGKAQEQAYRANEELLSQMNLRAQRVALEALYGAALKSTKRQS